MPTASFGIMVVEWMFTSAILADGQEWADTEGGILRSCAAYCLDRFQRYQKSRLEIKFNALFFYNTIIVVVSIDGGFTSMAMSTTHIIVSRLEIEQM